MTTTPLTGAMTRHLPRAMLIVAVLFTLVYAAFWAQRLPVLPVEQALIAAGPATRAMTALWAVLGINSGAWARAVDVLLLGLTCLATARLVMRLTGDAVLGAFIAFLWPWFPASVALQTLATPYAADVALTVFALVCLWPRGAAQPTREGLGAAALTVAALLDPFGAWNALAAAFVILLVHRRVWPLLGPAIGAACAVIATTPVQNLVLPSFPSGTGLAEVLRPYAFFWAAGVLGAIASRHRRVRGDLGLAGTIVCRTAPFLYAGLVLLAAAKGAAAGLIAGAVALPFAFLGLLPLGVWIRRAMPEVRSLLAWIAFPVIMYCGFWAILGPVKTDRFPYVLLQDLSLSAKGLPGSAR